MRMPGLDLLRSIAIVWVMLFHSFVVGGLGEQWAWLSHFGWMGVDLFFVLSGFLIGSQVLRALHDDGRMPWKDFYRRRAFRILPAFLVVLLLYVWWPAFREAPGMEPWWKFITFIVNLSIDYPANAAFSHAWSLCVEEHFYLLFPLMAWWMLRKPSAAKFIALVATLVIAGVAWRTHVWITQTAIGSERNWFVQDIYYPTWCRLDGLLAGIVLAVARVYRPIWWQRQQARANLWLLAGIAGMALSLWLFRDRVGLLGNSIGWPVLSASLAMLVLAGASRESVIGKRALPGMAWIAAISYSLYLSHKAVFHLVQLALGEDFTAHGLLAFAVYAVVTLAGGALLYYAVERPFLRLRERLEQPASAVVASAE